MIVKIASLLLWTGICPLLVGCLWTRKWKNYNGNVLLAYFCGLVSMLFLFEVLAIPMVFLKCSLGQLRWIWGGCVLALCVLSVVLHRSFAQQRSWIRQMGKRMNLVMAAALVCIALQAGYVTEKQHIDEDDAFYLATATTAAETDSLFRYNPYTGKLYKYGAPSRYVLSAWPLFLAALSQFTGFHPTILAHSVLPGIIVLWAYLVYALLGACLFPGNRQKQSLFLLLVVFILSFSGYSIYSSATFLFIRGWQGKAVLAGVGIPGMFLACWMAMQEKKGKLSWNILLCTVGIACMFTSMGVLLSILIVGCCGLAAALGKRDWHYLAGSAYACLPALICGGAYLILK